GPRRRARPLVLSCRAVSYWKLIANAAWAGLYATLWIAGLLVLLNGATAGVGLAALARAAPSLGALYGPGCAVVLATLFVCLRFFAVRRLTARWRSLKAIVWFTAAMLGWLTFVAYLNLSWCGPLLSPAAREALRVGAAVMLAGFLAACILSS